MLFDPLSSQTTVSARSGCRAWRKGPAAHVVLSHSRHEDRAGLPAGGARSEPKSDISNVITDVSLARRIFLVNLAALLAGRGRPARPPVKQDDQTGDSTRHHDRTVLPLI